MSKFSEDLWDGFNAVAAKTEQSVKVVQDITEFLQKRAAIEANYAKELAALCKQAPGAGGLFSKGAAIDKESKTLKAAFLTIQEEGAKIAAHHQEFSAKITSEVVKPLELFIKQKDNDRKKAIAEAQKKIKAQQEAKGNADKIKEAYMKAMKEAEQATEAHEKAKLELSGAPDNKKFVENEKKAGQKATPLVEKGKQLEQQYQKAVETSNDTATALYRTHLPPSIESLQTFESEKYTQVKTVLEEYQKALKAVPSSVLERSEDMQKHLDALDMEEDFKEFTEANKSGKSEPELLKFARYKEPEASVESKEEPKEESKDDATTTVDLSGQ
eukprot:TRINITY_DN922_c0_g1_i1.p1 TRINITY_DN922_c0_g1~~TRINITY_DN922_c0_g1_i1.p1  ORF type:complete len:329 (-),score=126.74 TRINITY_DN922_c0_g1_i1:33-1019(-)